MKLFEVIFRRNSWQEKSAGGVLIFFGFRNSLFAAVQSSPMPSMIKA
jgi:hypothetical protein